MTTFLEAVNHKKRIQLDLLKAIRGLDPLNRETDFQRYREKHLDLIFMVLMTAAIYFTLGWQLLDYIIGRPNLGLVFSIRLTGAVSLILLFSLYLFLSDRIPIRYFIYFSFYMGALFSPFMSYFTGGLESPYWLELVFLLILWFMMIPFSFKKLALHALIFIAIYSVILYSLVPTPVNWLAILEHAFIFSAVYVIGLIVSVFNNIFSATVYRSEQQIKSSEERFRMFTQNSLDVVWTIEMKNLTFTYVSPSVFQLRGYKPEELIGQPITESMTPDSRLKLKSMLSDAIDDFNKGNRGDVMVGEIELYKKNRDIVWIEVIASFITDNEGNIVEMMGDSRNITERKKAERELLNIQENLKLESQQLQQENLRIQYESLKSQVNPHFLFNSLNVLTSLIKIDPDLAERFAEQMSKVYRYVLEHREEDLVTLRTELDFINSYVFLLEIRFADKIKVNVNIPESFMEMKVPPLTVQLLIENAVKHNMFSKKTPLVIDIFIDADLNLNVINNLKKREIKMGSTAVGLVNIESRFRQLTNRELFFGESGGKFIARIPVLE